MYYNETTIMILVVAAVIAVYLLVPYLIRTVTNKGYDSIRNARVRNAEANGQPKRERLADRYNGTQSSGTASSSAGSVSPAGGGYQSSAATGAAEQEELMFCPYCGADLSHMEKDDLFCVSCGARLR